VKEIDAGLKAEVARLELHRDRIERLAAGDSLALPPEAVAYLDRLRDIGLSERTVNTERDGWIMFAATSPELIVSQIQLKMDRVDDEDFRTIYKMFDEASDWDPDDPRLEQLADALSAFSLQIMADAPAIDLDETEYSDTLVALLDSQTNDASPAWNRLQELMAKRGWSGWTSVNPPEAP
jgi:hypothetical protein